MRHTHIAGILARCVAAVLGVLCAGQAAAQLQGYPNRVVRFIVAAPPGGSLDLSGRVIATKLSERVGQPVIVENRVGAAGIIGLDVVAKAAADGHTMGLASSGALTVAPNLRADTPINPLTDLTPITRTVDNPIILVANPSFGAKSLRELIAMAKASPGKITFGTPGTGTTMHLAGAQLNRLAGIELVHAPYKGTAPAANDLVGGHIPIAIIDVASSRDFVKQGRLKAIATTGPKRALTAPDVPTVAESGLPGYAATAWHAITGPARTPSQIIRYLNAHIVAILKLPDVRERFLTVGLEPAPSTPEELGNIMKAETAQWAKLIKDLRITAQ